MITKEQVKDFLVKSIHNLEIDEDILPESTVKELGLDDLDMISIVLDIQSEYSVVLSDMDEDNIVYNAITIEDMVNNLHSFLLSEKSFKEKF